MYYNNNTMEIKVDDFSCNICNKKYASYNSLWNHNKKYHKINKNNVLPNIVLSSHNIALSSPYIALNKTVDNLCNICNKTYDNYNLLCEHNKKFHDLNSCQNPKNNIYNVDVTLNNDIEPIINNNISTMIYDCEYCNKIFNSRQNKWRHQKYNCKIIDKNKNIDKNKIIELENKIIELESNNNSNNNVTNNNNNVTNSNNTTNNIVNNITNNIVTFRTEDINKLSKKDKRTVLDAGFMSLLKLIEVMHLNKDYPQYQNIKITNLKDNFAKIYDDSTKNFSTVNKIECMDDLISVRTDDLKIIHKDFSKKNNMFHTCVSKLINKVESCRSGDVDDKTLLKYYKKLQKDIALKIYNNKK